MRHESIGHRLARLAPPGPPCTTCNGTGIRPPHGATPEPVTRLIAELDRIAVEQQAQTEDRIEREVGRRLSEHTDDQPMEEP